MLIMMIPACIGVVASCCRLSDACWYHQFTYQWQPRHGTSCSWAAERSHLIFLQVLAGVRILFSRVIPLEQKPESHALWRLALSFGAVCVTQMDAGITHVITNTVGTEKVMEWDS